MAGVAQIMDELAAVLDDTLSLEGFQVVGRLNLSPTEPAIDIYPADPFRTPEEAGFQEINGALNFIVRARVAGDADGRQDLLLALMDDEDDLCVAAALEDDQTLNGLASSVDVQGPSGYTQYVESAGGAYLGCEWRVRVLQLLS